MEGYRLHPQPAHLPFVAPYHHPHHPLHQTPLPAQQLHPHLHHLPQHHHLTTYPHPQPTQQQYHPHFSQHAAYLRPITPPPSPHDATYAANNTSPSNSLSSSTSTAATSHWDHHSVSSATTDRARTPRPTAQTTLEGQVRASNERFLLVSKIPEDSTNDTLKAAFRSFGDLIGIYKLFLKDGIVILAFYDSRQCLDAHRYLLQHNALPDLHNSSNTSLYSSQLMKASQLASLIGDSEFIREAEGTLTIQAEAFVNSVLLQGLLEQHGDLCSFESLDSNGLLYKCEFYDARHAHAAMNEINASSSYPLGVPLKASLTPALVSGAAYAFPPTPTTPHYGRFAAEDMLVRGVLGGRRGRHDTMHLAVNPKDGVAGVIGGKGARSRRSSTGTSVVPGETTPFALEKFRASLQVGDAPKDAGKLGAAAPFCLPPPAEEAGAAELAVGLGLKIKETGAGLMLLEGQETAASDMDVDDEARAHGHQESLASSAAQQNQHRRRRPNKIALPPFMGPLPLPSPLPPPSLWSGEAPTESGPFPFSKRAGAQVIYNSDSPKGNRAHLGPRLRSTTTGGTTQPKSATDSIPPLYAPANRPLLPLSARTSLSQTRDPPSPRNAVDIDKIANGMDTRTTIMIKNVPSRMTLADMEAFINKVCEREYDFLYLRMDFVTGNNVGYAFVNFIEVSSLLKFLQTYLGKRWNLYSSDKVMYAAYATYQGKAALVTKFQNSSILDREEKVKPHIYYSSGENRGLPEPFPPPNDSARKARSLAAASEHGLFSRMEYNRRQQLSQHGQPLSPTTPKYYPTRSSSFASSKSGDGPDCFGSASSYASPHGQTSPLHPKANAMFGSARGSGSRKGQNTPHTAMYGRRASATMIQTP